MTHQRNVDGLRFNAQIKSQKSLKRAEEAIQILLQQGRPVTFKTVAEVGRLSIPFLYKHQPLKKRIEHLRKQYQPKEAAQPKASTASDASKEAMLAALRAQIRELRQENEKLRRQIEVAYGLAYSQSNSGTADQSTSDDF